MCLGVWGGLCLLFILFYFILTHHMYEINCENLLNALSQGHESSVWPQGCTMCSAEGHIYKIVICPDTKRTLKSVCGRRLRKGGGVCSKLQLRFGILCYWCMAVILVQYAAGTRGFLRSHGAPKRTAVGTGVRRARTGGGIRACRWGWTGTGGRTDGSSAGSKRASRALFPIFVLPCPPFLSRFSLLLR